MALYGYGFIIGMALIMILRIASGKKHRKMRHWVYLGNKRR